MKTQLGIVSAVLLALSGAASAGTFSLTTSPNASDEIDVITGGTTGVQIFFTGDGSTQDAQMDFTLDNFADLTITPVVLVAGSTCGFDGATLLRIAPPSGAGTALTSTPTAYCRFDIAAAPAAALGPRAISTTLLDCAPLPMGVGCEFVGAGINVIDTPPEPPVITFNPDGGAVTLAQGGGAVGAAATNGTITVTAAGGVGGGTGSYDCTVPAGFTVSNNANASFGNGSVDMTVGCTMGATATSAGMSCAVNDANGASTVDFTLGCPAGASAVYSSAPPPGGALAACNGAAGATVNTTLTISNTGTPANPDSAADDLALACSVTGTGFAIASGPATPLEAGDSTTVTVECTIPASGTENGTLTCNGNDYALSASVRTAPILSSPALVPSTSFWSKMILFGLLAGLGMLVVSLRRNG